MSYNSNITVVVDSIANAFVEFLNKLKLSDFIVDRNIVIYVASIACKLVTILL